MTPAAAPGPRGRQPRPRGGPPGGRGPAHPVGDRPAAATGEERPAAGRRHPATGRDGHAAPASHTAPAAHPRGGRGPRRDGAGAGRDRGQAAIEFAGWIGFLLIAALAAIQLGIVAYAAQQAGTAARAAARVASQGGDGEAAGLGAMSGWLADGATVSAPPGDEEVIATVTVSVPTVLPLLSFDPVTRTTTMPVTTSEGGTS
ncbi:TadE/TadG family type IV pilus assembly protein [Streptomyces sp. enrichment culture]|uniref:TadE/TadG family type IV pilus assembly protein n=1 Tax=Streptomyces sp. enrichment culture TaxID=1795815 RepID=UPI003F56C1E6